MFIFVCNLERLCLTLSGLEWKQAEYVPIGQTDGKLTKLIAPERHTGLLE